MAASSTSVMAIVRPVRLRRFMGVLLRGAAGHVGREERVGKPDRAGGSGQAGHVGRQA